VEDQPIIALSLSPAAEDARCIVLGPVAALSRPPRKGFRWRKLPNRRVWFLDAPLVDCEVTSVAFLLLEMSTPFVLHTGTGLPSVLETAGRTYPW